MSAVMELTYYPGCSLKGTSEEYDHSIRAVFEALGIGLTELEDWTCCGASSAHMFDDSLANMLAGRNLVLAGKAGLDMLVPCAACYSRLKFAEKAMAENPGFMDQAAEAPLVRIVHIHDLLAMPEVIERIRGKVVRPLHDLGVVPYYGCLTVRPPKVVDAAVPENPTALDEVLEALGARLAPWSFKTDCCGGSFSISRPDVVRKLSGDLMEAAQRAGGECIATDCPMCQANLDSRQQEIEKERGAALNLPVFFITELIALAMGIEKTGKWLSKHLVDPRPLLRDKGLA